MYYLFPVRLTQKDFFWQFWRKITEVQVSVRIKALASLIITLFFKDYASKTRKLKKNMQMTSWTSSFSIKVIRKSVFACNLDILYYNQHKDY